MSDPSKKDWMIGSLAILFFVYVVWYCIQTDFEFYIADSIIFIIMTLTLMIFYKQWYLDTFTFSTILIGLALHDLGAFRFYATPPIPFEWDIVTHVFGIFAVTLWIYNVAKANMKRSRSVSLFALVLLASLGVGVIIEFIEFYGFATTGFGEGFFGRGFGDFDPRVVSSDYIDTIQDLFWNTIGAVVGFVAAFFRKRDNA